MKEKETRQPWNAFPLASLSVAKLHPDITPCALDILRILAIRSNWTGAVWVGQRRIAQDAKRSKGYVTEGIKQLAELKLITTVPRQRSNKKADKHIISLTILPPQYQEILVKALAEIPTDDEDSNNPTDRDYSTDNPTDQDDSEDSIFHNPTDKDFDNPTVCLNNPTRKDETLQYEPVRQSNLTGSQKQNQNQVSELVSESSFASLTTVQDSGSQTDCDQGFHWEQGCLKQDQPNPKPLDARDYVPVKGKAQAAMESAFAEAEALAEPLVKGSAVVPAWTMEHWNAGMKDRERTATEEFIHDLMPDKTVADADVDLLLALIGELKLRGLGAGGPGAMGDLIRQAWDWNQTHKTGKWKLYSVPELVKALRSESERNLLAQMWACTCEPCLEDRKLRERQKAFNAIEVPDQSY